MSGRGSCYDNAPVKSFFSLLKRERIRRQTYRRREEAKANGSTTSTGSTIDAAAMPISATSRRRSTKTAWWRPNALVQNIGAEPKGRSAPVHDGQH